MHTAGLSGPACGEMSHFLVLARIVLKKAEPKPAVVDLTKVPGPSLRLAVWLGLGEEDSGVKGILKQE